MALNDFRSVLQVLARVQPDEIYNLAGQSSVGLSFDQPVETLESISVGTLNLLEVIRFIGRQIRLYNAGSSECFGNTDEKPANEETLWRDRASKGDASALGQIYDSYAPRIYRYLYRRLGSQSLAEDLTADVFVRLVESAGTPRWAVTRPADAHFVNQGSGVIWRTVTVRGTPRAAPATLGNGITATASSFDKNKGPGLTIQTACSTSLVAAHMACQSLRTHQCDMVLAGGVSINDTLLQYLQEDLPFGGIGSSGMGAYHGREGFLLFSHCKAVFEQSRVNLADLLRPPYRKRVAALVGALMR